MRILAIVLAILCATQVWLEGAYWQWIPIAMLLGLGLLSETRHVRGQRLRRAVVGTLVACSLLLYLACSIFLPVPVLPLPSGRYAVGTSVHRWTVPTRDEPSTEMGADRRGIVVQAWYPALADANAPRAPYLDGLGRLPERVAGLPRVLMRQYDRIDTHAVRDAAVNTDVAHWPVVLFSPGYGATRSFYTSLLTDLASRGVIVLAIDHPYEAAVTELDDGRIVTPVERFLPTDPDRTTYMARQTDVRIADLRDVLDAIGSPSRFGALTEHLTREGIVAAGHSFGGAASVALAATDARVSAAVNIDGTMYGATPDHSLQQPFLLIESDHDETQHGRLFLEGHARLLAHARGPTHRCQLERANHYSFTDAPLLLSSPWRWLASVIVGGSLGVKETVRITNDLLMTLVPPDGRGLRASGADESLERARCTAR